MMKRPSFLLLRNAHPRRSDSFPGKGRGGRNMLRCQLLTSVNYGAGLLD